MALAAVLLGGCSAGIVERAIAARGGPLESYSREVDARVYRKIPGEWSWVMAYRYPESFRWTLRTFGEEQSVTFDGERVRFELGRAPLPGSEASVADVRSQARWLAVTSLDVLTGSQRVAWQELPRSQVPSGYAAGIRASFGEGGGAYELYFDQRDLLVAAAGQVALQPIGSGRLEARFSDFRETSGFLLPYRLSYRLEGEPLLDEQVARWVPNASFD
jgi:hypothetical protein